MRTTDPGWKIGPSSFRFLVPGLSRLAVKRAKETGDALTPLREVFVAFCVAPCLIGVAVVLLCTGPSASDQSSDPLAWAGVVAAANVVTTVLARVLDRPLDGTNDASLRDSYQTRFFKRIGFTEAGALVGFVCAVYFSAEWSTYFVAAPFVIVGMWWTAPTHAHLNADQRALRARGCDRRLLPALLNPPSTAESAAGGPESAL